MTHGIEAIPMKLEGIEYKTISSGTIEWDATLFGVLESIGLSDVTMHSGEDAEGLARRIFRTVFTSGRMFEMLGCVLIPAEMGPFDWTPDLMRRSAALFRRIHSPAEKAELQSIIASLVVAFFRQGMISVRTFPRSSSLDVVDAAADTTTATKSHPEKSSDASGTGSGA